MGVVITTCRSYAPVAVPPLLRSLRRAGVPDEAVHVVVGECQEVGDERVDGVWHHRRRYCNLDNNGLMWLGLEAKTDQCTAPEWVAPEWVAPEWVAPEWVVYLHDTCLVAPHFWARTLRVVASLPPRAACVRLHRPFSMGMGLYRTAWVQSPRVAAYLRRLVNLDPGKTAALKRNLRVLEDTLFKFANPTKCLTLANKYTVAARNLVLADYREAAADAVPRLVEYYATPGVYKLKANYDPRRKLTLCI